MLRGGLSRAPHRPGPAERRTGEDELRQRVARAAEHPPGGVPSGWRLAHVDVSGAYDPERGEWWHASVAYAPDDGSGEIGRLIGAGPTARAALTALEHRLGDPLTERRRETEGGWDPAGRPGRTVSRR